MTVDLCQRPLRRASIPRPFNSAAIARKLVAPPALVALDHRRQVPGVLLGIAPDRRPQRRTAFAGPPERCRAVRLPSFTPRAFVTASVSFVRFEIASRWA